MNSKKKYKVIIPEHMTRQIDKMPLNDKKMIMKAIDEIAENPLKGEPMDIEIIPPLPNEKCKKCGMPFELWWDKNSNEVSFHLSCRHENGFWMYKKELEEGRKNYLVEKEKNQRAK